MNNDSLMTYNAYLVKKESYTSREIKFGMKEGNDVLEGTQEVEYCFEKCIRAYKFTLVFIMACL